MRDIMRENFYSYFMTLHAISTYLEQLELVPLESKVYLTLCEIGYATARDLSRKLGVARTSVYPPIDALIEKGLIMKVIKSSQPQFVVTPPKESLPALLETLIVKKNQDLKSMKDMLPRVTAELETAYPQHTESTEPEVRYYKGKAGVKKIYEEALTAKELRSYANLSEMEGVFPGNLLLFVNAFQHNPHLTMYEIVEDSPASRKQTGVSSLNKRYSYKFLPKEVTLHAADTLIYDGKVAIINIGNPITGIVFTNEAHYNNSKELFDFHWKTLPEVKRT